MRAPSSQRARLQALVGAGVIVVALGMAWGATSISSEAGYAGVGPNFLPWLMSGSLLLCGGWLVWEALSGGYRDMDEPSGAEHGDWRALAWMAAGLLANAALITTIGFVFSCALCFALAVRGLRASEGRPAGGLRRTLVDAATGIAIAAPVYWVFTKVLNINLPGATGTGWL